MTDITGSTVGRVGLTTSLAPAATRPQAAAAPATGKGPRTVGDLRFALSELPVVNLRRGYRPEAVERLVEKVIEEVGRRAAGEPPFLLAEHVHPNGFAMARPGYAIDPTRELLEAAAEMLRR